MKGHLGAVLTSGLTALAIVFAVLQAAVLVAHTRTTGAQVSEATVPAAATHRFSVPGGRSAIPYQWNSADPAPPRPQPDTQQKREEPRRTPPRSRGTLPERGPRPPRRVAA